MEKVTEQHSLYRDLEHKSTYELLLEMNEEDQKVPIAVKLAMPQIMALVEAAYNSMQHGGRLFYIGAGTSGRLGILDASECPPTFGVPHDWVIGLIAGGDQAIRKAVEHAEDDRLAAWQDLKKHLVGSDDFVIGIAASGTTPYVLGGLEACQNNSIQTGCITCNPGAPIIEYADFPICAVVGPEYITGSTRMKSGTAQKLILNMISSSLMIKLSRVKDNKMVDMHLSNDKLILRGTKLVSESLNISMESAKVLLLEYGSVRKVLESMAPETL